MSATRLFGGLLSGIGDGLNEKAAANRRETLTRMINESREDRSAADNIAAGERNDASISAAVTRQGQTLAASAMNTTRAIDAAETRAQGDRAARSGLLSSVIPDAEGNMYGISAGGEATDLGLKSGNRDHYSGKGQGNTMEEQRLITTAIMASTTDKGSVDGEVTDWANAAKRLDNQGYKYLADQIRPLTQSAGGAVDYDSAQWRKSELMAKEWASEKETFWSLDSTDFKKWQGSKSEAIRAKAMQIYADPTSFGDPPAFTGQPMQDNKQGSAAGERQRAAISDPSGQSTAAAVVTEPGTVTPNPVGMAGEGSKEVPWEANTQEQIDWFLENAEAGDVIRADGKLYQK